MMDEIYVDIRSTREVSKDVIAMSRAKAYQMALCILSELATSDSHVSESSYSDLLEDDNRLPPMP